MKRLALLAMLLVACEREGARQVGDTTAIPTASTPAPAAAPSDGRPACPATGQWSRCAVIERLDRAGLAPRLDSTAVATEAPLTQPGLLVRVGNSELELFIYADDDARKRDEAALDREKYVEYPRPVPMRPLPTLIRSVNLLAILHSRNEHQRERVSDAITAGPPQPSSSRP